MGKDFNVRDSAGQPDQVECATKLFSAAFTEDPLLRWQLGAISDHKFPAALEKYFRILMEIAVLNDAKILEINDWRSCVVMFPPGRTIDTPVYPWISSLGILRFPIAVGLQTLYNTSRIYTPRINAVKKRHIPAGRRYHYVFFIATDKSSRGQGLCSELLKHYQEIAAKDNASIWLEASTAGSRRVYEGVGFEMKEVVVFGKGKVNELGQKASGGSGITVWGMLWSPPSLSS